MRRKDITRFLGSDIAQQDKHFLDYAITRNDLSADLENEESSLIVINAPRGSGKSGLLISLENSLTKRSENYTVLNKYYEDVQFPDDIDSLSKHVNFWKNTILGWVVANIGANRGVALNDDDMAAVEYAEQQGNKELNVISSVLKRLKINSLPVEKLNFDAKLTEVTLRRILKNSNKTYWLLLDEMDDLYSNSIGRNHSLVALFQVANFLVGKFENLKIRITIRPHIYTYLVTNFDSVQKIRECVMPVSWTEDQLKSILARRVEYYDSLEPSSERPPIPEGQTIKKYEEELISRYFDDFDMRFANGIGSSYRALHTASLERPRWMIELCKIALEQQPDSSKATTNCFKLAFAKYGQNRVDFISGEYMQMYPDLSAVINSIVGYHRIKIGDSKKLRSLIKNRILEAGIISVPEGATEGQLNQYALAIAKSLYIVEFIRAKQNAGGAGNDHRHYNYTTRPSLLDSWSNEKNIAWEIHPTFARALNITDSQVYTTGGEARNYKKK